MVSLRTPHSLALPGDTSKSKNRLLGATYARRVRQSELSNTTDHLIPGAGIMRSIASLKYTPNRNSGTLTSHNRALRIMREREENIQCQTAEGRGRVELLGHGNKTY